VKCTASILVVFFSDEPGISYRPSLHLTNAIEAQKEYRNTDEMRLLTFTVDSVERRWCMSQSEYTIFHQKVMTIVGGKTLS